MSGIIRHEGVVESVGQGTVRVRIEQAGSCAACAARQMCVSAERREKTVDAVCSDADVRAGDRVEVQVRERLAWRAVVLAYVLPFVILTVVAAVLDMRVENEALTGTAALCAVGVYYIVLSLFKGRLKRSFSFTAVKLPEE
jgi:sigma-E factor negative regulatory protein RseC